MRLLVCGGRNYAERNIMFRQLDKWHLCVKITVLIHGDASGADTFARLWAEGRRVRVEGYPIEHGEGGFARNQRMFSSSAPEAVMHFPGGNGTAHMVKIARIAGIDTIPGLTSPPDPVLFDFNQENFQNWTGRQ